MGMENTAFTVYGLRVVGERETRYIGQTNGPHVTRLMGHLKDAEKPRHNLALAQWLLDNWPNVESFAIAKVASRAEALGHERVLVALCQRLNQRLLNINLVSA